MEQKKFFHRHLIGYHVINMKYFTYKIEHDYGLAPNPFFGYCTLAVCKSQIRMNKNVELGSWIFGSGSVKLNQLNKLIYAMRVDEILPLNDYWHDPRFECKKPVIRNGSIMQFYGDNFYHQDDKGNWIQENSAHSNYDDSVNESHLTRDVGGYNVMISKNFYYFGRNAISIPEKYSDTIFTKGRNWAYAKPENTVEEFLDWLAQSYQKNFIYGDPNSWGV